MAAKIFLILAVFCTLLITTLSLVQLGDMSVGKFSPTDKMMHTGAYFVLSAVWMFYYLMKVNRTSKMGFLKIAVAVIVFGILIEVFQGVLTSYREPEWADILANTIGVVIAFLFFSFFLKFLKRLKHKINLFL